MLFRKVAVDAESAATTPTPVGEALDDPPTIIAAENVILHEDTRFQRKVHAG